MKLYTRTGDDGSTGLWGGTRVGKDSLRVEAYGTVDELNCFLGWCVAACATRELTDILLGLQRELFELGAELASPPPNAAVAAHADVDPTAAAARLGLDQIRQIEGWIDQLFAPVPLMRSFILPGGSELAARLHVARAVARRAERLCVALGRSEPLSPHAVIYLNRVSDLLFAMARRANQLAGVEDVPWTARPG